MILRTNKITTIMLGILMSGMILSCSSDDSGDVVEKPTSSDSSNKNSNTAFGIKDAMRLEVPHLRNINGVRFLSHQAKMTDLASKTVMNYCMEYDSACHHSRWVAFTFDDTTKVGNSSRSNAWNVDPSLPVSWRLSPESYSGSGFTRGHLCASADRLFSSQANQQTFYMSNMSPQLYNFNTYYWAELELLIRNWSKSSKFNRLYVCKGGTIKEGQRFGGLGYFNTTNVNGNKAQVVIPKYYFMAILAETKSGSFQSIAFLLEQHGNYAESYPPITAMKQHVVSVDYLEEFTGIDFFCNLNDKLENVVEASNNPDAWTWN